MCIGFETRHKSQLCTSSLPVQRTPDCKSGRGQMLYRIGFDVPNVLFNKVALTGLFTVEPLPVQLEHSYTLIAFTRTRVIGAL